MKAVEAIIRFFSPEWAARRAYWDSQAARLYEAGQDSIYRRRPRYQGSGDRSMEVARERIRDWARHLDENHDLAIGVLDELVNKVVGSGITLEPAAASSTGRQNKRVNRDIARLWARWSKHPEVTNELSFSEVQRQVARTMFRDGEVLAQHVTGNQGRIQHQGGIPYSLELIEPDYLPFDFTQPDRNIIHGVEKNAWGRPRAYFLYKTSPDNVLYSGAIRPVRSEDLKRVQADRMVHLKFTRRLNQTRGVSVFHGVAHRLDDLKDYEESERIAAKVAASATLFIRKGNEYNPTQIGEGERQLEMQPGMIYDNLLPGEEIGMVDANRPNTGLNDFRNSMMRAIATGTGTSYSSISRNYDGTYSAQRQEMVESIPAYAGLREYFISAFLQPIYERFIEVAIASGQLSIPASIERESLLTPDWIAPAMPWIDPKKEVEADILAIDNGIKTRAQVIRERTGKEPERVKQNIRFEQTEDAQFALNLQPAPEPEPAPANDAPAQDTEPDETAAA